MINRDEEFLQQGDEFSSEIPIMPIPTQRESTFPLQQAMEQSTEESRGTVFLLFQIVLSGIIATAFIAMNTVSPDIYTEIVKFLKTEVAVTVDFRQDGEQVVAVLKRVLGTEQETPVSEVELQSSTNETSLTPTLSSSSIQGIE